MKNRSLAQAPSLDTETIDDDDCGLPTPVPDDDGWVRLKRQQSTKEKPRGDGEAVRK